MVAEREVTSKSVKYLKDLINCFTSKQDTRYNVLRGNCHIYASAVWIFLFPKSDGTDFEVVIRLSKDFIAKKTGKPITAFIDAVTYTVDVPNKDTFTLARKIHNLP